MGEIFLSHSIYPHMLLTDTEILSLRAKSKPYKVYVGKSLYLLIMPTGQKYWRLRYYIDGKEKTYALGVFPAVSIKAATAAREAARMLIREGIDPTAERRKARRQAALPEPLFLLGLSKNGALTIETDATAFTLTVSQTRALAAFLGVRNDDEKEPE